MNASDAQGMSPGHALTLVRSMYYTNLFCCVVAIPLGWALYSIIGLGHWPLVGWIGFGLGMFLFVTMTAVGLIARQQSYKRHWVGDRVTPRGYMIGMITFHTIHEITVVVSVVLMFVSGALWPAAVPAVLATIVMALAYPNGKVMEPVKPTPEPTEST